MNKSDSQYKTIGEVAKILNLKNKKTGTLSTHTIRFWEKEFKQVRPKILNANPLMDFRVRRIPTGLPDGPRAFCE